VGERGGVLFIAMKLVHGRSLDVLIREQGALPAIVALHILRSAARALAHAHERGIVHRDVKGANLLIDRDGRVLVSDFGVALRASDITLTMDGALIGTPAYMSPEQCKGKRAGSQSDQYSLGIVAFEILTGVVPFDSDTLPGFIRHHLYSPVPDIRIARDDLPPALVAIVERALQKSPEQRFHTTRAMLDAIEMIPFSETDRRASEGLLGALVRGASVTRVPTRSFPAIPEAETLLLRVARPAWRRPGVWSAGVALVALSAALILWPRSRPAASAVRDSSVVAATSPPPQPPAPSRPPAAEPVAPPGMLRVLANPTSAEILVDERVVAVGSAINERLAAGRRRIRLRAVGYTSFDTSLTVAPGSLVNLGRRVLQPQAGAP
jgi:hypothetical protein